MLKTEHILYRSGTRLGIDAATAGAVFDAFTRELHLTLMSGAAVDLGSIGCLYAEDGRLVHVRSCEGIPRRLRLVNELVAGMKDDISLPLELTLRLISDVFMQVTSATERRESTELRAIGVWSPESSNAGMRFLPAMMAISGEGETHAAVDVRSVVATVHSELGYTPPADTVDPSGIDIATLVRLVRNNMPEIPSSSEEAPRHKAPDTAGHPASTPENIAEAELTDPDLDTAFGVSTESDVFEFNREQLYHPPARRRRPFATAMAVVVVLVVFLLLGYLAWTNGLLDSILPDSYDHGTVLQQSRSIPPEVESRCDYTRGIAMYADRLNRPSISWSTI